MSSREKKLVWVFGCLLFVVVFLFYIAYHNNAMNVMRSKLANLKGEVMVAESADILDRELLEDKEWLSEFEPKLISDTDAEVDLMKLVNQYGAGKFTSPPKEGTVGDDGIYYKRISVLLKVKMLPSELNTFLCRLHQPNKFRAVTSFTIIPADNSSNSMVKCTAVVEQWLTRPEMKINDL